MQENIKVELMRGNRTTVMGTTEENIDDIVHNFYIELNRWIDMGLNLVTSLNVSTWCELYNHNYKKKNKADTIGSDGGEWGRIRGRRNRPRYESGYSRLKSWIKSDLLELTRQD